MSRGPVPVLATKILYIGHQCSNSLPVAGSVHLCVNPVQLFSLNLRQTFKVKVRI